MSTNGHTPHDPALLDAELEALEAKRKELRRLRRNLRISAALADPEVRARMSAARKAALADPEVRARMSAARKAALADPEVRARLGRKKLPLTPEQRKIYRKLRAVIGREAALAEATK